MKVVSRRKFFLQMIGGIVLFLILPGCGISQLKKAEMRPLDYTVLKESEIPEKLQGMIQERIKSEFRITYRDEEALYVVCGYGEKPTGGYSIQIKDVYLSENAIHVVMDLVGPSEQSATKEEKSYPYIVLKMESRKENVIFE